MITDHQITEKKYLDLLNCMNANAKREFPRFRKRNILQPNTGSQAIKMKVMMSTIYDFL